jgi:hypothetical protein
MLPQIGEERRGVQTGSVVILLIIKLYPPSPKKTHTLYG